MKPNNFTIEDIKSHCDIKAISDCWEWRGARNKDGYGKVSVGMKDWRTHRLAFILAGNDLAEGELVLHQCDNPPCCNPRHLFKGSQLVNRRDCVAKKRTATGDKNGSRVHPEKVAHGDNHGLAVMTSEKVKALREMYDGGDHTIRKLSVYFRISNATVRQVTTRKTWRHI